MTAFVEPRPGAGVPADIGFVVNGAQVTIQVDPMRRLSDVLRDDLGMIGTKVSRPMAIATPR